MVVMTSIVAGKMSIAPPLKGSGCSKSFVFGRFDLNVKMSLAIPPDFHNEFKVNISSWPLSKTLLAPFHQQVNGSFTGNNKVKFQWNVTSPERDGRDAVAMIGAFSCFFQVPAFHCEGGATGVWNWRKSRPISVCRFPLATNVAFPGGQWSRHQRDPLNETTRLHREEGEATASASPSI